MGEFSFWHLIMILAVVLIFFGPSRLPGLGNSLGKAIRGFKEGMKGLGGDEPAEKEAQIHQDSLSGTPDSKDDKKK